MTPNPARAAGAEHESGRPAIGHRADFTVFAENPLATPATDLTGLPVVLTVADGRATHRDAGLRRNVGRGIRGRLAPLRPAARRGPGKG
ncbi:amidohydrolase family protein [Streptomyces sp. NPDC056045]|uniref:amidohydrolase family protein n=1 Tax=Streptomyces sp. NPDC056045 TaxID=3345691 RepID=UPI0035DF7D04